MASSRLATPVESDLAGSRLDKHQTRTSCLESMAAPGGPGDVMALQRLAGNRAVASLLGDRVQRQGPDTATDTPRDQAEIQEPDVPVGAATAPTEEALAVERFDVDGVVHTLWVDESDGEVVVMVASDPMTVPQRLRAWTKQADKMDPSQFKTNIQEWISRCWTKSQAVVNAAIIDDPIRRVQTTHTANAELREMIKRLFFALDRVDVTELGAVAVYRGLHFTTDWQQKRGRTVAQEGQRSLGSVQAEGSYSSATWELAGKLAQPASPARWHLESANRVVMEVLEKWKATTDYNRADNPNTARLEQAIVKPANTAAQIARLRALLERSKGEFTQSQHKFESQLAGALSRYIDQQSTFETELRTKVDAYGDVPFGDIPFISTTKVALESVKYAQGKLAKPDVKSTAGVVGRVMVYVADKVDFMEAGGVDVWKELTEGRLRFTEWRMAEQEITFSGKVPDHFLKAMTPVHAGDQATAVDANVAEKAAAGAAASFGGLLPLPKNQPLR